MRPSRTTLSVCLAATALTLPFAAAPGGAYAQVVPDPAPQPPPTTTPAPANNPLAGDGMWIWYVRKAQGGKPGRIAKRARQRGIEVVLIKSGDGTKYWGQFTSSLVGALHARGI